MVEENNGGFDFRGFILGKIEGDLLGNCEFYNYAHDSLMKRGAKYHDAEDCINDAFGNLIHRDLSNYLGEINDNPLIEDNDLKRYLFGAISNAYGELIRKDISHKKDVTFSLTNPGRGDGNGLIDFIGVNGEIPLDEIVNKEEKERLYELIGELPKAYKNTIELRLKDMDYRGISRELGIPIGTVKSRLYTGKKILKEKLRKVA